MIGLGSDKNRTLNVHAQFTMFIERLIHKKPSEHLHFQKFLSKLDFMPVLDNLVNWTKRFLSGFLKTKIDPWHHHQEMKDSSFCELDLPIFSHLFILLVFTLKVSSYKALVPN